MTERKSLSININQSTSFNERQDLTELIVVCTITSKCGANTPAMWSHPVIETGPNSSKESY